VITMFKRSSVEKSNKSQGGASLGTSTPSSKPKQGRERLAFFAAGISKAHEAIEDLEQRIARFESIIAEAQLAHKSLQAVVHEDGGRSLSDFSSGKTAPDDKISKLVALAKTSREAALAAADALPHTREALDNARTQLATLCQEKAAELNRVVANLADEDAQKYWQAFLTLGRLHDQLVGYSYVAGSNLMAGEAIHVQLTTSPLTVPRFIMPSLGSEDSDPLLRHSQSQSTVEEAARKWSSVRERLDADDDCDLNDLLITTKERTTALPAN
jgi:hypothetical protein